MVAVLSRPAWQPSRIFQTADVKMARCIGGFDKKKYQSTEFAAKGEIEMEPK